MDDKFILFLKKYNLYNEEIFNYIESRTKRFDYSDISLSFFGCFPILDDNNRLIDIRMCVPYIDSDITRSINIHEYIHLLDLYYKLNTKYIESNMSELLPVFYEFVYLYSIHNKEYLDFYKEHINNKNNYLKIIIEIFDNNGCIDMEDNKYKELIDSVKEVTELNKEQLIQLTNIVNDIINSNNTDINYISFIFDQLLSLVFIDINILKKVYLKLVNYVRSFNKSLAEDYLQFFIEDFELEEDPKIYEKK